MTIIDRYPYWIEQNAQGEFIANFPDFPDFKVSALSIEKLLDQLHEAILTYLEEWVKDHPIPEPSALHPGEETLFLRPTLVLKLRLQKAVREQNISGAELARRLGCLPQEAVRILKISHPTKIDTMVTALEAVGLRVSLTDERI